MMYHAILTKRAEKALERLPKKDRQRVSYTITALEADPFRGRQLHGDLEGRWSVRVWPYRIVYTIEKEILTVTIVKIGHRKDVYR